MTRCTCTDVGMARSADGWRCLRCGRSVGARPRRSGTATNDHDADGRPWSASLADCGPGPAPAPTSAIERRPRLTARAALERDREIRRRLKAGESMRGVARALDIGLATVHRAAAAL